MIAALLTSISAPPNLLAVSSAIRLMSVSILRSAIIARASVPISLSRLAAASIVSVVRAVATTLAPRWPKASAIAFPTLWLAYFRVFSLTPLLASLALTLVLIISRDKFVTYYLQF